MIVLGIDTATRQASIALGTESGTLGSLTLAARPTRHEAVLPALEHLTRWTGTDLGHVGGVVVGIGPGLFTSLRVGVEVAKSLAQVLGVPILGIPSLDVLAFAVRQTRDPIAAMIDARRGEVFVGRYRPAPGGVQREGEYAVRSPEAAAAEIQALGEETLLTGDGATLYRDRFEELGGQVVFAPSAQAHPDARALIELAIPRFEREEHDRLFDVVPIYLRKSDAEIAWDRRSAAE